MDFFPLLKKSLINKYSRKLLDSAKKSTRDTIKTSQKRAIQKTAEAAGGLIGNKSADKITSVSKKPMNLELHSKELTNNNNDEDVEIATPKKRYMFPEERKQIIDELRLVPKKSV